MDAYENLFVGLIDQWRNDFGKADLPFHFVEIARYNYKGDNFAIFREMQFICDEESGEYRHGGYHRFR